MGHDELVVEQATVAVRTMFTQVLQLPIEQPDEPSAHDLILRDGDRGRPLSTGVTPTCHTPQ